MNGETAARGGAARHRRPWSAFRGAVAVAEAGGAAGAATPGVTGDQRFGDVDLYRCGVVRSLPVSRAVGRIVAGLGLGAGETLPRLLGPATARALPLPAVAPPVRVLRTGQGALESVTVDDQGRLFFSSQTRCGHKGAILRMDAPDAAPEVLVGGIVSPGGLAWDRDGRLIVGYGDSPHGGLIGNWVGLAGLLRVDPDTGVSEPWVSGLGMSNGVARAPDGAVYASNDIGTKLDRVDPDGTVQRGWARVASANGLAVDPTGRFLYASQTFVAARIARVDLRDPGRVTTHARAPLLARASLLDGLAIDDSGRLFVAANGAGQVWRVDPDGAIHALARGLRCPSAVALGRGPRGFCAGNVYAVTFAGDVVELERAARHQPSTRS